MVEGCIFEVGGIQYLYRPVLLYSAAHRARYNTGSHSCALREVPHWFTPLPTTIYNTRSHIPTLAEALIVSFLYTSFNDAVFIPVLSSSKWYYDQ